MADIVTKYDGIFNTENIDLSLELKSVNKNTNILINYSSKNERVFYIPHIVDGHSIRFL